MKYIGNKKRLLDFIEECLIKEQIDINKKNVIDLFSGTGSVSSYFLSKECNVISCDNMTYSIAEQYRINYFKKNPKFEELKHITNSNQLNDILEYLNNLEGELGYFYNNFAPSGISERKYFSDYNAKKIDVIRCKIEEWKSILPYEKYMFLLGILMNSADKISNTSGTYGAYLKIWRSMALKDVYLDVPELKSKGENIIIQNDVIECVKKYKNQDIIYLDPPYNTRQYASNFHVLESIVVNDNQQLRGKTGLRDYSKQKSKYSMKTMAKKELEILIDNCDSKFIIMSYSTEGIINKNDIFNILSRKGKTKVYEYNYRRFKTNSWTEKDTNLKELLFITKIGE